MARATVTATALSVAPVDFLVRPGTAYAQICECVPGTDCGCSQLCCDGYTQFCCTINDGVNACPPGTFAGGWWKADGSVYCAGPRYYIDCMGECQGCGCWRRQLLPRVRRPDLRVRPRQLQQPPRRAAPSSGTGSAIRRSPAAAASPAGWCRARRRGCWTRPAAPWPQTDDTHRQPLRPVPERPHQLPVRTVVGGHGRHGDGQGLLGRRLGRRDAGLRRRRRQSRSLAGVPLAKPVVGMAATADREGLLAGGGRRRRLQLRRRPVPRLDRRRASGQARSPAWSTIRSPAGYRFVATDGGCSTFDAPFYGSLGQRPAGRTRSWAWPRPRPARGTGWWPSDGGIFAFGDAHFYGSLGDVAPGQAGGRHGRHTDR